MILVVLNGVLFSGTALAQDGFAIVPVEYVSIRGVPVEKVSISGMDSSDESAISGVPVERD